MQLFSALKDKFLDQFGVLDDAQDYWDQAMYLKREASTRVQAVQKLLREMQTEIQLAESPDDLDELAIKQAIAISKDLAKEVEDVSKKGKRLIQKGQRDEDIWPQVKTKVTSMGSTLDKLEVETKRLSDDLVTLWEDHKKVMAELREEKGEHPTRDRVLKKIATIIGVIGGILLVFRNIG